MDTEAFDEAMKTVERHEETARQRDALSRIAAALEAIAERPRFVPLAWKDDVAEAELFACSDCCTLYGMVGDHFTLYAGPGCPRCQGAK